MKEEAYESYHPLSHHHTRVHTTQGIQVFFQRQVPIQAIVAHQVNHTVSQLHLVVEIIVPQALLEVVRQEVGR
jgi:hypothetical protein